MREIAFHRLARQELHAASAWYGARSEEARSRFRKAISYAIDRIATDPRIHPLLVAPYRCIRVRRFPYLLIFESCDDDRVLVVAVAHTSRRPGYWQRRK